MLEAAWWGTSIHNLMSRFLEINLSVSYVHPLALCPEHPDSQSVDEQPEQIGARSLLHRAQGAPGAVRA